MNSKKKPKVSFESGLKDLEGMVSRMQAGDLPLEDIMKTYEQGMQLAAQLEAMLEEHRRRIEQIDLETAEIMTFEENENDLQ